MQILFYVSNFIAVAHFILYFIFLVRDSYGNKCVRQIHTVSVFLSDQEQMIRFFTYQHIKYVWQNDLIQFGPLKLPYEDNLSLAFLLDNSLGLTKEQGENA